MSVLKSRNNVSECPYPLQVFEEPVRYYSGCGYKKGSQAIAGLFLCLVLSGILRIQPRYTQSVPSATECLYRLISQPDEAPVFLLGLLGALGRLEGMEVPADAQPKHPAAVLAVVEQGEHRIVGMYVPAAGIEHIRQ